MKNLRFVIYLVFLMFLNAKLQAQGISVLYATGSGNVKFSSETPVENIKAENTKAKVVLNTVKNEIAIRMNMRDFEFPNKLMQEHFNENYMESVAYPTATFTGNLDKPVDFSRNGTFEVTSTGDFTVHGVTQKRTFKGTVEINGTSIVIKSRFEVALEDHKIDVPQIVFVKIARKIQTEVSFTLHPFKRK